MCGTPGNKVQASPRLELDPTRLALLPSLTTRFSHQPRVNYIDKPPPIPSQRTLPPPTDQIPTKNQKTQQPTLVSTLHSILLSLGGGLRRLRDPTESSCDSITFFFFSSLLEHQDTPDVQCFSRLASFPLYFLSSPLYLVPLFHSTSHGSFLQTIGTWSIVICPTTTARPRIATCDWNKPTKGPHKPTTQIPRRPRQRLRIATQPHLYTRLPHLLSLSRRNDHRRRQVGLRVLCPRAQGQQLRPCR